MSRFPDVSTAGAAVPASFVCAGRARLCFTGVPAERLDEGIDRINAVLEAP